MIAAQPLDTLMDLYDAGSYPCHLLVETRTSIDVDILRRRIAAIPAWTTLFSHSFSAASSAQAAQWKPIQGHLGFEVCESVVEQTPEQFDPDAVVTLAGKLLIVTKLSFGDSRYGILLSWSHVFTDARGGEYLLSLLLGGEGELLLRSVATTHSPITTKSFRQHCADRNRGSVRSSIKSLRRDFLEFETADLGSGMASTFFRSALIVVAAIKATLPQQKNILAAIPTMHGRKRCFPGNQLGTLMLRLDATLSHRDLYQRVLEELEENARNSILAAGNESLLLLARSGREQFKRAVESLAGNRFADLCVSCLGKTSVTSADPSCILAVRHYPPLFSWGGETIVYYECGERAALVHLCSSNRERMVEAIFSSLKETIEKL